MYMDEGEGGSGMTLRGCIQRVNLGVKGWL